MALSIGLLVGRLVIHRKTTSAAMRWAGYLNAIAEVMGLATFGAALYYLPLLYGLWESSSGAFTDRKIWQTAAWVQAGLMILFWLILLFVKLSTLMLFRAIFAISVRFKAAWWGVLAFTVMGGIFCSIMGGFLINGLDSDPPLIRERLCLLFTVLC